MVLFLQLALTIHYWSIFIWISFVFSVVTYIAGTAVYNSIMWP